MFHTRTPSPPSAGDTFTFSDVTRGVLLYRHAGLSGRDDTFTISVSDGISMATTVVQVALVGAGEDGPQRDPAATLSLEVGQKSSTVIGRSYLAFTVSGCPPVCSSGGLKVLERQVENINVFIQHKNLAQLALCL